MNRKALALALLAPLAVAADTQKKTDPAPRKAAPAKESAEAKARDIARLVGMLGMPKANSEAARRQLAAAAKDPKMAGMPEAYWKDYQEAASPQAFERLLLPLYEKAYTHDEVKALLRLLESPEYKLITEKQPEGMAVWLERNPTLLRAKAYESFSAYMTETGRKLRDKHGIKSAEPAKK